MAETASHSPLQRQRRPSGESKLYLELKSPKIGHTLHGIAINNDVEGVLTHWVEDVTQPCLGALGDCPGCRAHRKPRWKGFLPVVLQPAGTKCLFEITRGALESCPELNVESPNLRGRWVKLYRRGTSKRSPCVLEVGATAGKFVAPPQVDVYDVLDRLWGLSTLFPGAFVKEMPDEVPTPD